MLRYDDYKKADLKYVNAVPSHWGIEKGKWLFHKNDRPVRPEDDVVTCFRDGEVTLRSNRRTDGFTNAIQEHGYQGIRKGDLVIHAMDAFAGAIGVSDSDGKSTPVYSACTPRNAGTVDPFYYTYLLRNMAHTGFIESLAKGIRERSTDFRFKDFSVLGLPHPPIKEQTAIANFLDRKTALIARAIAQKERLIELLRERRQILIQRAVTRGLDPEVELKDSGVEWIGMVPAHWEVKRLKTFVQVQTGITLGKRYVTSNLNSIPYLRVANVQAGYFDLDDVAYLELPENEVSKYALKSGDLLVTEGGDIDKLGRGAVWKSQVKNCIHQNHVFAIRIKDSSIQSEFVSIAFGSSYGRYYFTHTANKTTNLASTNSTKLGNFPIALPPSNEMLEIMDWLKAIEKNTDITIETLTAQIDKLKEYRATLIDAAVTGKIKVN